FREAGGLAVGCLLHNAGKLATLNSINMSADGPNVKSRLQSCSFSAILQPKFAFQASQSDF
ncbi:MAG: hypothetical protein RKP46_02575, partial [Candidatus Accumulibacter sp.]|uniref:hypothetical protein n=1 Tax=Accumulibacter sp. TaxID=2053492 RepID=UPI002878BB41